MSKSLRVIYSFQNDTANNIQKINNATQELILAESVTERRIQIHEIDDHRKAHVDTNYKSMYLGIKTVLTILEKALHGKPSTDIALIECGESCEGASINAYLILRHWGPMQTKGPQGPRFALKTLMSKNEVRIYGCARARLTAFTLLLG